MTKRTSWLLLPPTYSKFGGKTVNAAYISKAPVMSQLISSLNGPDYHPRISFRSGTTTQSTMPPQSRIFVAAKVSRQFASRLIGWIPPQRTFFCVREVKGELAGPSRCLRVSWLQGCRESSEPSAITGLQPPFGAGWTSEKSTSQSAWTGPKKVLKWKF